VRHTLGESRQQEVAMLFLYRPRQTWMPFRRPRPRTEQDKYNWQLQQQYQATQQVPSYTPDAPAPAAASDPIARLEQLGQLHESGALTDAEFAALKAKILDGGSTT
jgi:hypothetical protein